MEFNHDWFFPYNHRRRPRARQLECEEDMQHEGQTDQGHHIPPEQAEQWLGEARGKNPGGRLQGDGVPFPNQGHFNGRLLDGSKLHDLPRSLMPIQSTTHASPIPPIFRALPLPVRPVCFPRNTPSTTRPLPGQHSPFHCLAKVS